jgi:predicted dehydrogenase
MGRLRWGVLGCGIIANEMAAALAQDGRTLAGVANRTRSKADAFAEKYGVEKVYDTFDEMLADPDIDAVYITTPHNTHIEYLRRALPAGKHVLCEKSVTLNTAEFEEAAALAKANNVVFMDAMTIFHMPLYQALLERLRRGDFGRVNLVQLNFGSYKAYDMTNRFFNMNLAGGAMLDIGVYAFSLATLFTDGPLTEVHSIMNPAPTGVDESSAIIGRTDSGQLVSATLSMHSKQPKRAVISCEKCYIEIFEYPRADSAKIVWSETGEEELFEAGERPRALSYEMGDVERAVEDRALAEDLLGKSRQVMRLMTRLRYDWGFYYPEEQAL